MVSGCSLSSSGCLFLFVGCVCSCGLLRKVLFCGKMFSVGLIGRYIMLVVSD